MFNAFMEICIAREKMLEAMWKIEEEEVEVVNNSAAVKAWDATHFDEPSEVECLFAIPLGYSSALRGSSSERMEPKVFETHVLPTGPRPDLLHSM